MPTKSNLRPLPGQAPSQVALARSTVIVMVTTLASTALAYGRDAVAAKFWGANWEMDAYVAASTIPTILFGVFYGALLSALVPVFTEYNAAGDAPNARRLTSTVFNGLLILLSGLALLGWVFAPYYVPVVARGFTPAHLAVTVEMTRWLMPSVVATSLAGVTAAILNAHQRFNATAVQGIAANLTTIACVLFFARGLGIFALVLGTAAGFFAQVLVQLPSVLRYDLYRPIVDLGHPGLRRIASMLGPIVIGSVAGQVAIFFDRFFASTLTPGYMAGMNYAIKLVGLPQQIFAAAVATVIFPLLVTQFTSANKLGVRQSVVMGLRLVNLVTIPSVFGLIILARPIVATLFQRGEFGRSATDLTAGLLPYTAIGLVGVSASIVLTRCCFACKATKPAIGAAIVAVVLNVVLSASWLPTLGARGLLLANSLSQWTQAVILFCVVWSLVGGLDWKAIFGSAARILGCSLAMAAVLYWIGSLGVAVAGSFSARVWYLAGELVIGASVFVIAAQFLRVAELPLVLNLILKKFEAHAPAPAEGREAPIA